MSAGTTPPSEPSAPDFAEPLLGFRVWRIEKDGRLGPITGGASWKQGVNRAECMRILPGARKHSAPSHGCGCGFNAFHHADSSELRIDSNLVVGAIAAWGEVDIYRTGFRAEFACVVALSYSGNTTIERYRRAQRAAERYEVRLVEAPDLVAEASRFATPLPVEALPKIPPPAPARPGSQHAPPSRARGRRGRRRPAPAAPTQTTTPGFSSIANVSGPAAGRVLKGEDVPPWCAGEHGYRLRSHTAIAIKGRVASVSPTPAFLTVIGEPTGMRFTAPGSKVLEGDVLAAIDTDLGRFALRAPFDGTLVEVNTKLAATAASWEITSGDWLVRMRAGDPDIAASATIWGDDGWNSYRRYVSARDDAAILADLALHSAAAAVPFPTKHPDLGTADGVRWLAAVLDPHLEADEALQSALAEREVELAFWVPRLGAGVLVRMQRPDRPTICFVDIEPDSRLLLSLEAEALQEYWTGELDLAAALGGRVGLRGPRDEVLRATALLRRLCPAHLERVSAIREAGRRASRSLSAESTKRRRAA